MLPDLAKEQVQLEYQDRIAENRDYFEKYGYPTTQTYHRPDTFEPWTIQLPPSWNPRSVPPLRPRNGFHHLTTLLANDTPKPRPYREYDRERRRQKKYGHYP
jgi:hypothetical protein